MTLRQQRIVASLEIGSNKIVCLVGYISAMGRISIKGIGHQQSKGICGGKIINKKEAEKSILSTISMAEKNAGFNIQSVTVNLSASEISSSTINTSIQLDEREVNSKNIISTLKNIKNILKKDKKEIIHLMPLQYLLDDDIVESPYGIEGNVLKITFHLLSTTTNSLIGTNSCMKTIMLDINNYVSNGYATSLATLSEIEKELGAMILDIGHNNTGISVVYNNKYVYEGNIGIAGENITKDISTILRVTYTVAEKVKVINTDFTLSKKNEDELIKIQLDGEEEFETSRNKIELINNIAKARIEEIVELVLIKLRENHLQNVPKFIVLTGGTALIPGIDTFVSKITGFETRIGYNTSLGVQDVSLITELKSPMYSVSMGILKFIQNKYKDESPDMKSSSIFFNIFKKIFS